MPPRVFISYARLDRRIAKRIARKLEELHIDTFLDEKSIEWGDDIFNEVVEGIRRSSDLIVIISPASLKSSWVPFEVGLATGINRRVLVYLTHPSLDVPGYLKHLNFISDLTTVTSYYSKTSEETAEINSNLVLIDADELSTSLTKGNNDSDLRLTIHEFVHDSVVFKFGFTLSNNGNSMATVIEMKLGSEDAGWILWNEEDAKIVEPIYISGHHMIHKNVWFDRDGFLLDQFMKRARSYDNQLDVTQELQIRVIVVEQNGERHDRRFGGFLILSMVPEISLIATQVMPGRLCVLLPEM